MKTLLKIIAIAFTVLVTIHLILSYYFLSLNPATWHEGGRFLFATFSFLSMVVFVGVIVNIVLETKSSDGK